MSFMGSPEKLDVPGDRHFELTPIVAFALQDGVIGEPVSGYVKPNEQGHLVATTVNFGSKGEEQTTKSTHKKK